MKPMTLKQFVVIMIVFGLMLLSLCVNAQKLTKDASGNWHMEKLSKDSISYQNTGNTLTDGKGQTYPIYKSRSGKFFIIRTSKNTGNQYKQYLKIS